jgi:hypothetical protein
MATISRDTVAMFDKSGAKERRVLAFTGGVYATGGDSLTPESIALKVIEALVGLVISNGSAILWGFYNQTTKKILWYSATGTEVTNATDLSAYTGRFEAIGR